MQPGAWVGICRVIHSVGLCPHVHAAEVERAASSCSLQAFRQATAVRTSLAILACFQLPPKSGHMWGAVPKGEETSATGDGINNWDMSMGTQWNGECGLWEPFWNSILGMVGIPRGASVCLWE